MWFAIESDLPGREFRDLRHNLHESVQLGVQDGQEAHWGKW